MITMMIHRSWAMPIPIGTDPSSVRVSNPSITSSISGNSEMKWLKITVNLFYNQRIEEWQPTRSERWVIFSRAITAFFNSYVFEFLVSLWTLDGMPILIKATCKVLQEITCSPYFLFKQIGKNNLTIVHMFFWTVNLSQIKLDR